MKRYNLRIVLVDNSLGDVTTIERNSDEPTWMWMANTMFDALRGASFVLPDNIDFPSISEIVEEWEEFDEEDPRSDGENYDRDFWGNGSSSPEHTLPVDGEGWIPHDPAVQGQPVGNDVEVEVKYSDGHVSSVWHAYQIDWYQKEIIAWRYADQDIGYGGTD